MKQTINVYDFRNGFTGSYKNNFSYEGLGALFEYLERLEEDTGEEMEYDPIAICCDYTEYDSLDECLSEYSDIKDMDELKDNTNVIELDNGGVIIQNF